MALRTLSRLPVSLLRAESRVATTFRASFSADSVPDGRGPLSDRERALENRFFNKEDEKLMRQLLGKLKRQADEADVHRTKAAVTEEMSRLEAIVSKYKMTKADLDALIAWRHNSGF